MIMPYEYRVSYTEYCSKFIILEDMSTPAYSEFKVAPKSLDEFQYFTSITKSPLSLISKSNGETITTAPVTKITFPENLTKIADIAGGRGQVIQRYLTEIKFLSQTPPTYYAVGDNHYSDYALKTACADFGIIYVPKGSKEDYINKTYISSILTNPDWTIEEF